jgi:hypothetical protein
MFKYNRKRCRKWIRWRRGRRKKDNSKSSIDNKISINNILNKEQPKENNQVFDCKDENINFNEIKNDINIFNSVYSENAINNINIKIEYLIKEEDNISLDIDE